MGRSRIFYVAVAVFYCLVELFVYFSMPPQAHTAPDTMGYVALARDMAATWGLPVGLRLPGYPLFLSVFFRLGLGAPGAVVFVQAALALACAVMAKDISRYFLSGYEKIVYVLTLFNPYGLLNPQLLLPETLFAFLLSLQVVLVLAAMRKNAAWAMAVAGALTAGLVLIRANGIVLFVGIPLILLVLWQRRPHAFAVGKLLLWASVVPAIVLAGWVGHVARITGAASFISPEYSRFEAYETLRYIDILLRDSTDAASETALNRRIDALLGGEERAEPASRETMFGLAKEHFRAILWDYGPANVVLAWGKSLFLYFFSTGATMVRYCVALPRALDTPVGLSLLCFVVCTRLLDGVGVYYAIRKKDSAMLAFVAVYVVLFAAPVGFFGMARYRYPIDFMLFILACYGFDRLWRRGAAGPRPGIEAA